jgi:hypothetical protein
MYTPAITLCCHYTQCFLIAFTLSYTNTHVAMYMRLNMFGRGQVSTGEGQSAGGRAASFSSTKQT